MEEENNNKLPFLDVLVERSDSSFLTSVYRKHTFTGLYLSCDSFAPRSRKLDLIRYISFKALNICCNSKIDDELKVIKEIFINKGYPEEVIDDNIKLTVTRLKIRTKVLDLRNVLLFFFLDFLGLVLLASPLPRKLPPLCAVVIMLLMSDQFFTTNTAFTSIHKDKLLIFKQSFLINKFNCRCNSTYIGRTCERLEVRIRRHVPRGIITKGRQTSGHFQAMDSAIGEHLLAINSCRTNY